MTKAWSQEARDAANEARRAGTLAAQHERMTSRHSDATDVATRAPDRNSHSEATTSHAEAANSYRVAQGAYEDGDVAAGVKAANEGDENARNAWANSAAAGMGKAITLDFGGGASEDDDVLSRLTKIAKTNGAVPRSPGADGDAFAELRSAFKLSA